MRIVSFLSILIGAEGHGAMVSPVPRNQASFNAVQPSKGSDNSCLGDACYWYHVGCSIGCSNCSMTLNPSGPFYRGPQCSATDGLMEPTNNDPKFRTWDPYGQSSCGDFTKYNPWRAPGKAPVHDPCGVASGLNQFETEALPTPGGFKAGDLGSKVLKSMWPTGTWMAGKTATVGWSLAAHHGGGYSYRLCPKKSELTEECFQNNPLAFTSKSTVLKSNNGKFKDFEVTTATYTAPDGVQWRTIPFPGCACDKGFDCQASSNQNLTSEASCEGKFSDFSATPYSTPPAPPSKKCPTGTMFESNFEEGAQGFLYGGSNTFAIYDQVQVPTTPGDYVLSWRWDCEQTDEIWNSCADIVIRSYSDEDPTEWAQPYEPTGWTAILNSLDLRGSVVWDPDVSVADNFAQFRWAGFIPIGMILFSIGMSLVMVVRLWCCSAKASYSDRGRSPRPAYCCAGASCMFVVIGLIIFLSTAIRGVDVAKERVVDFTDDAQTAAQLLVEINTTVATFVPLLDSFPPLCQAYQQQFAAQLMPYRNAAQYMAFVMDVVAQQAAPLPDQLNAEEAQNSVSGVASLLTSLLSVPLVLVFLACSVILLSVCGTDKCAVQGSYCTKCENFFVFKLGSIFLAATIIALAIISAVQFCAAVGVSNFCADADQNVVTGLSATIGPGTPFYAEQGPLQYDLAQYYIAGIGTNEILDQLRNVSVGLTDASAILDGMVEIQNNAELMAACGGRAFAGNIDEFSKNFNATTLSALGNVQSAYELFSPENVYPYYQQIVHKEVCGVTVSGLVWLTIFQVLVGFVTLPCLVFNANSFVSRRARKPEHSASGAESMVTLK